jgi:hypothetical protein
VQTRVGESEQPGERADAGEDYQHEGVDGVDAAAALDARGFEEERAEELEEVTVACVPEGPADAEFEGVGIAPDGA